MKVHAYHKLNTHKLHAQGLKFLGNLAHKLKCVYVKREEKQSGPFSPKLTSVENGTQPQGISRGLT